MDNEKETDAIQPEESGYTISEYLNGIEEQYRAYEIVIDWCISGLTAHAAHLAAQGREEQIPMFRELTVELAEFWGLTEDYTHRGFQEMAERYRDAFDQAVSAARRTGHAPALGKSEKEDILAGLELYVQEMDACGGMEQWMKACSVLADQLRTEWGMERQERPGPETGQTKI